MNEPQASSPYVIPPCNFDAALKHIAVRFRWLIFVFVVVGVVVGGLREGWPTDLDHLIVLSINGLFTGLLAGMAVSVVGMLLLTFMLKRKFEGIRASHNFAWYRETFPQNAHPNGQVSCRHCGSHKTRVTSLKKQTYTQLHSCASCGETLYFTPEKR